MWSQHDACFLRVDLINNLNIDHNFYYDYFYCCTLDISKNPFLIPPTLLLYI